VRSVVALHVRQVATVELHGGIVTLNGWATLTKLAGKRRLTPKTNHGAADAPVRRGSDPNADVDFVAASPDEGVRGSTSRSLIAYGRTGTGCTTNRAHAPQQPDFRRLSGLMGCVK
jgi:hypothetical protein